MQANNCLICCAACKAVRISCAVFCFMETALSIFAICTYIQMFRPHDIQRKKRINPYAYAMLHFIWSVRMSANKREYNFVSRRAVFNRMCAAAASSVKEGECDFIIIFVCIYVKRKRVEIECCDGGGTAVSLLLTSTKQRNIGEQFRLEEIGKSHR